MCGIGLRVDFGDSASRVHDALEGFDRDLRHRGPDAAAFLWGGRAEATRAEHVTSFPRTDRVRFGLAFRHLYVIERHPRAVQPLGDPSGSLWIALNGQIYNHVVLRRQLESLGHGSRTGSDAEVVLAAYTQWGAGCFERFIGMWGIVLIDLRRSELLLARDRLGIKGLYIASDPDGLLVASEPRAVARAAHPRRGPDEGSVRTFLAGYPPVDPEATFYDGVRALPAGTIARYSLAEPAPPVLDRYWRLPPQGAEASGIPYDEAKRRFAEIFEDSVGLRLGADAPVGCLLSGGLDSSLVAATAARLRGARPRVKAFSIIYREPGMSEIPHIWAVMTHAGLESHTHTLAPEEVFDLVDRVVTSLGRPLLGQELIAQYCAYRLAREHSSTVTLEGQGADELLAGLPSYAAVRYRELFRSGRWGPLGRELGGVAKLQGVTASRAAWACLVGPLLTARTHRRRASGYDWLRTRGRVDRRPPRTLDQYLRWLVSTANLPTVLQAQDHISMAHSVESRVPFLDHRLVELAFSLPSEYKVGAGRRKRILADVAREQLPEAVVDRRDKRAFVSSARWLPMRAFGDQLLDSVAGSQSRGIDAVDWPRAEDFVGAYLRRRHEDAPAVWRLHTLARWLATFD